MEILFTFLPKEHQQQQLREEFPDVQFHFTYKEKTHLPDAQVLVTYGEDITAADIESAHNLKWIMVASAGIDKMPHEAIVERGIIVSNVKGIHKIPMAESVLAHILALKRSLPFIYESQRNGEWNRRARSTELAGSTALIIGPGAIGSEIGRLLQAFGVQTIGCNRSGEAAEYMEETIAFERILDMLPSADIVISVLPSTEATRNLLGSEHFKAMKNDALFMNFGRGDLFEDKTLIEALEKREIGQAVLDVFTHEPLPEDHPYWIMPNLVISPHVSSHSGNYIERALEIFVPNLKKWILKEHEPTNMVSMEKGY